MSEPSSNRSNHVFKRFFRSSKISTESNTQSSDRLTHLNTNTTRSTVFRNIETGEEGSKHGRCGPCNLFVVWDNNFSMQLLGSKNAIEKEEIRRQALPYFILHPCCRFRLDWGTYDANNYLFVVGCFCFLLLLFFWGGMSGNYWVTRIENLPHATKVTIPAVFSRINYTAGGEVTPRG